MCTASRSRGMQELQKKTSWTTTKIAWPAIRTRTASA